MGINEVTQNLHNYPDDHFYSYIGTIIAQILTLAINNQNYKTYYKKTLESA